MGIKATTSCSGRFHIFDQARQLHRYGILHKLVTDYPKFKTRQWGIPDEQVISRLGSGIYKRAIFKALKWTGTTVKSRLIELQHREFSITLSRHVPPDTDVLIGLSSFMLEAIQWAKAAHIISIVDHGSLHERTEREILLMECERFGFSKFGNWQHNWLIEKEDAEFANADYVMVCSNLAMETLVKNGVPGSKVFVNHLGADLAMFYPQAKKDNVFRIIYCANMSPRKGVHYLVRAFNELALSKSELWLVGSPPQDPVMISLIRANMRSNVFFKGHFPQHKLRDVYSQGSVFVLPSLADGWGMVVLQAMACGLPVIVTDRVGAADAVSENINGFIVAAQSVDALKEKLLFLYGNPVKCVEMGQNALKAVRLGYSWDDYGDRLQGFLQHLNDMNR